ncbi:hypothetical protein ACFPM1_15235 [Halorubrum rubrum]|uniref:Transcriptional regulator n=1 Tax=Halorubrum rubrum TaxID=1126240 RepID=A0ABD5R591_9EURY|nr:hypothetical protein [Halorubrum rubrum]
MADSDEYEPCGTLVEFLQLKGSIGLIALLYERPRAYSELESEIEITSSTITRRRIDADHLGLLTVELESNDHGTKHVYTLTDLGKYVAERMANKGIVSSYYQMRGRQKEIEQKTEEIVEWVEDNPTNFIKFEAARDERIAPREDGTGVPSELEEVQALKEESDEETDTGADDEEASTSEETDPSESRSTSESNSETESSPTVVRPDSSDEPPHNPDAEDDNSETNTGADEGQSQLTDTELQDRLAESESSDTSKNDSASDDE